MPKGIAKNLHFVLSEELVWECNLDGKRNKTRLLGYSKFIDALFRTYSLYKKIYNLRIF